MGDPELRSDESVLLRTQGIYVKSIPFEGILTNKRIILVDRTTNILPHKEIPLVTLKDFQSGENAIRDQIITLSVVAKTGETRQIILTFSRQTGGNRIKERDDWLRLLKKNTPSSFEQVIRKVIPGVGQPHKKTTRAAPPRIEIIRSPVSKNVPAAEKIPLKQEEDVTAPVKKIIKTYPPLSPSSSEAREFDVPPTIFGTYCSRCGNRVPDGSKFCNRCGSEIVVPASMAAHIPQKSAVPYNVVPEQTTISIHQINQNVPKKEPLTESSQSSDPSHYLREVSQQPKILKEQIAVAPPESTQSWSDSNLFGTEQKPELVRPFIIDSHSSEPIPPSGKPAGPRKPRERLSTKQGKKAILGIIVVIIIVAIILGAFFIYPMISNGQDITTDKRIALTTVPTILKNSGAAVMSSKTLKPAITTTYRPSPGNSGSRVGQ